MSWLRVTSVAIAFLLTTERNLDKTKGPSHTRGNTENPVLLVGDLRAVFDFEQRVRPLLPGRAGDEQRAAGELFGALEQPFRGVADASFCCLLDRR